jgi:uncharacterized protein (TIGR03067 family)
MRDPEVMKLVVPVDDAEGRLLAGVWNVIGGEKDGCQVPVDEQLLVSRVLFTSVSPADIARRCDIYTAVLDPTANPARITATVAGGEIRGEQMLVIYRLDGDRLTLRLHYGAKTFPVGFKTAAGDGTLMLELKRAKGASA